MEEKSKKFPMQITLGHILTILTIMAAGVGVYTQLYADVSNSKIEISTLKRDQIRKEMLDKEQREEIKQEMKDVKSEIRNVNDKVDRVLFELRRNSAR